MNTAAALRLAFDRSFASPAEAVGEPMAHYIAIRLADCPYALPMRQIGGLHAGVEVVPCPSPLPELLGLAGFRRTLIPVYDLTSLMGHPAAPGAAIGWMALSTDRLVGFAFGQFDGHFRAVTTATETPSDRQREAVLHDGRAWPVIDLNSLEAALRRRTDPALSKTE